MAGEKQISLAREFCRSRSAIRRICLGTTFALAAATVQLKAAGLRRCPNCGPLEQVMFVRNPQRADGLSRLCRTCTNARTRSYRTKHLHRRRLGNKQWYHNNPDKALAAAARRDKSKLRDYQRRRTAELHDGYVAANLARGACSSKDIPPALIEAKRIQIQLRRVIRSQKWALLYFAYPMRLRSVI